MYKFSASICADLLWFLDPWPLSSTSPCQPLYWRWGGLAVVVSNCGNLWDIPETNTGGPIPPTTAPAGQLWLALVISVTYLRCQSFSLPSARLQLPVEEACAGSRSRLAHAPSAWPVSIFWNMWISNTRYEMQLLEGAGVQGGYSGERGLFGSRP